MFSLRRFYSSVANLPQKMVSENFVVRFGLRNPIEGRGLGPIGVRWDWFVPTLLEALEQTHQCLVEQFGRSKPRTRPC